MKKLLVGALLFSLPVLAFIGACEYLLYSYKENVPIKTVIAAQMGSKRESYYNREFFDNSTTLYKLETAKKKNADILIIGRSTVLNFRAGMFHPFESSFYNMGFAINSVAEIQALLALIKTNKLHKPKLIIIGLDASTIKTGFFDHVNRIDTPHKDEAYSIKLHFLAYQLLLRQIILKEGVKLSPDKKLGFGYLGDCGVGFRNDGSRSEAVAICKSVVDPRFDDNGLFKEELREKQYPFDVPYRESNVLIKNFLALLADMKKNGITPVIYFPPVADEFYNYICINQEFGPFFKDYLTFQNVLLKLNYDVIGFKTPRQLGLNDNYMLNSIHPGETMVGKLWYNFLVTKPHSGILASIDTAYLGKMLAAKQFSPLAFMPDSLIFPGK
jgi:hypothetical protein